METIFSTGIFAVAILGVVWILRRRKFTVIAGPIHVEVHDDSAKGRKRKNCNGKTASARETPETDPSDADDRDTDHPP